ncbi:MAG: hypothetical protein EOL91_09980, partial [Actinobacteria bacterium]|nr:hypothetical protein [Actinomycetota bacterium]
EINEQMLACIDTETGEIINTDMFDALQLERTEKLENIALWIKNLKADAEMYKAEKNSFADKQKQAETKVESLRNYLDSALNGKMLKTAKVNVTYRKSTVLEYDGVTKVPEHYLKYAEPTIDKTAIKDAMKTGEVSIDGFKLVVNNNIQIK